MRVIQLVLLFVVAASTSATIGPVAGSAGGLLALGKSLGGLASAMLVPSGIFLPLALAGSLKAFIGLKALGIVKLKLAALGAPVLLPAAVAVGGKAAMVHAKAHFVHTKIHLVKTAAAVKAALIDVPIKLTAAKVGAISGAIAGGKSAYSSYHALPAPSVQPPSVILASDLLRQAAPAPAFQPEPEAPSYGSKAHGPPAPAYTPSAHIPAAPAYVPAPQVHYRKRRQVEVDDKAAEEAITEAFNQVKEADTDLCVRRSICAVAVQPDLALTLGPDMINALNELRDDATAPWYPYKQAVATGERAKSHEVCAKEYPTCTKDIEALITGAVEQFQ